MKKLSLLLPLIIGLKAIPIDNGITSDPEIDCGPTTITVSFNVQNDFEGNVYVKSLFDQADCKVSGGSQRTPSITLPFDGCNTQRSRSLNPKGIFVTTVVVISFHPQFVTKVDRAYRVQCFYMETEKTVETNLEVSDLTTSFQSFDVPMPICKYEILDGGPTGDPVHFATIGQQVYHKWTCNSDTVDTFCAIVHSCYVDDGNGNRIEILNHDGCALDKYLLTNLEYPTDLMAGQEPNEDCPRPVCAEPAGFGAVKPINPEIVIDVKPTAVEVGGTVEQASSVSSTDTEEPAPPVTEPSPLPETEAETQLPSAAEMKLESSTVGIGYRSRRSASQNIIDVSTDLETLDILQPGVTVPHGLRRRNMQYFVEVHNGVCITPLQFSFLFGAVICLIIIAVVTYNACKR